jgi:serine-type D-Ala-D-Ala carboxypeptidase (penicillin-binding protein 5/6)
MQGPRRGLIHRAGAVAAALVAVLALAAGPTPPAAAAPPEVPARAWVLVDARDGSTLAARAADTEAPVASATKLMTAYAARRDLPLSKDVAAPPYQALAAESLVGLRAGERISVRDLLYGLILASGNDAAFALADAAAGSQERFVAEMNRDARRLGLRDTSYANPIGLDQAGNYSSARDLATLAIELRQDRFFRKLFDTPETTVHSGGRAIRLSNRNTLVRTVPWVNGIKTGYTLDAGYVLVGSGARKGVTLVSAVLGAPSESDREAATLELLEYGFSQYRREAVVKRGERLANPSVRYQDDALALVADREVALTLRRDQTVATDVVAPDEIEGPVDRGERLGEAVVTVDGEAVGRVALVAARGVPAADLGDRVDDALPGGRVLAWGLITAAVVALLIVVGRVIGRRRATR